MLNEKLNHLMLICLVLCGCNSQIHTAEKTYSKRTVAGVSILSFILGIGSFVLFKNLYKTYWKKPKQAPNYAIKILNALNDNLSLLNNRKKTLETILSRATSLQDSQTSATVRNYFDDSINTLEDLINFMKHIKNLKETFNWAKKSVNNTVNDFVLTSYSLNDLVNVLNLENRLEGLSQGNMGDTFYELAQKLPKIYGIVENYSKTIQDLYLSKGFVGKDLVGNTIKLSRRQYINIKLRGNDQIIEETINDISSYYLNTKYVPKDDGTNKNYYFIGEEIYSQTAEKLNRNIDTFRLQNEINSKNILKAGIYKQNDIEKTLKLIPSE